MPSAKKTLKMLLESKVHKNFNRSEYNCLIDNVRKVLGPAAITVLSDEIDAAPGGNFETVNGEKSQEFYFTQPYKFHLTWARMLAARRDDKILMTKKPSFSTKAMGA